MFRIAGRRGRYIDLQIHTVATPHHARWQPEALAQHAHRSVRPLSFLVRMGV